MLNDWSLATKSVRQAERHFSHERNRNPAQKIGGEQLLEREGTEGAGI
jgi:hypothetical protein